MKRRTLGLLLVLLFAGGLTVGALALLNRTPQARVPSVPQTEARAIAKVDDEIISVEEWREYYLLDQLLSQIVGERIPTARETLEQLIDHTLLLRDYPPSSPLTKTQVTQHIRNLEASWQMEPQTLTVYLEKAGLTRAALTRTVTHLLRVEAAQRQLEAQNPHPAQWLREARQRSKIWIDEAQLQKLSASKQE